MRLPKRIRDAALTVLTAMLISAQTSSWPTGISNVRSIVVDSQGVAYVGTDRGAFKTINKGGFWTAIVSGFSGPRFSIVDMAVNDRNPLEIYLIDGLFSARMWKSSDGGKSWRQLTIGLPSPLFGYSDSLWVGPAQDVYFRMGTLLYKSSNSGEVFNLVANTPCLGSFHVLDSRTFTTMLCTAGNAVYASYNSGVSWAQISTLAIGLRGTESEYGVRILRSSLSNPSFILAGTARNGIHVSNDGGRSWRAPTTWTDFPVRGLTIDPLLPSTSIAVVGNTVVKSVDAGRTFLRTIQLTGVTFLDHSLEADPRSPDTLFLASWSGVYVSRDGGLTFALPGPLRPELQVSPPSTALEGLAASSTALTRTLQLQSNIDGVEVSVNKRASAVPWLDYTLSLSTTPTTMVVTARTANLQPGEYSSTLIVDTVNGESSSLFIPVRLTVRPVVILPSISSVVNAAGSLAGPTAARMIVTIFGDSLASGAVTASVSPLPTRLGDTEVKANGVSLQLFYAGPTQINAVMPERLIDPRVGLVVQRGDTRSPELSVEIAPAAPSFFEVIADGEGRAAITDAFGRVITRSNPARPGQVLIGYLSGMGTAVTRTDNSGLLDFSITPRVVVNGIAAQILYAGPAPGALGLDQVNFVVPVGFVTPADAVLYIEQQGRRTKSAQIPLAE